ncbi:hypothetical protein JOB18_037204 [Solea senegalensis]|uniref:Secreted protein n=1 Tax=Solea senegalensis TaxID=28829 RepID=A0AAV6QRR7_SOLSE|nr:hypothetical protein JOB18_037204 [Solea senegalensis]
MYFYLYVRLALGLVYTLPIPSHVYCRIIAKLGNPLRTSKRISGVTYLTVSPPAFQTFPSYYVSSFRQLSTQPSIGKAFQFYSVKCSNVECEWKVTGPSMGEAGH